MAVSVFATVAGMAALGFSHTGRHFKGTAGMQQVMAQLRMARDMAISQRRSVEVQFVAPNEIRTIRWEIPSGFTTVNEYFLEGSVPVLQVHRGPGHPRRLRGGVGGDVRGSDDALSVGRQVGRRDGGAGQRYRVSRHPRACRTRSGR